MAEDSERAQRQPAQGEYRGLAGRGEGFLLDRYLFLFALLIVDLVVFMAAPPGPIATFVSVFLVDATLLMALRTSQARPRAFRIGLVAAAGSLAFASLDLIFDVPWLLPLTYMMMSGLLWVTPVAIGRRILAHRDVGLLTVFGAVSIYVLIGMVFAFLYMGVSGFQRHPFFVQGPSPHPATYLYFSFITLTTVGFGDLTPASALDRSLVVLEALFGQIFLVTMVARLVSLYGLRTVHDMRVASDTRMPPSGTAGLGADEPAAPHPES